MNHNELIREMWHLLAEIERLERLHPPRYRLRHMTTPLRMILNTMTEAEVRQWVHWSERNPLEEPVNEDDLHFVDEKSWQGLRLCYDPRRDEAVACIGGNSEHRWLRLPTELLFGSALLDDPRGD
jgi:hypothetical protein